jgi:Ala-tRNA(Pro) deacylase
MALVDRLREFLDQYRADYRHTMHAPAYTARDLAMAEHLPCCSVAKTVIVCGDMEYYMVVIPANRLVDFDELRRSIGVQEARLATEQELESLFPDCELGAMPPAGNLYNMTVFLDSRLTAEQEIAFHAGTHRDVVHMNTDEYRRLVQPAVFSVAQPDMARAAVC